MVFYNGDIAKQNFTRLITTDGTIEMVYAPVAYSILSIKGETMLWPTYYNIREEVNFVKGDVERVALHLKIMNPELQFYKVLLRYEVFALGKLDGYREQYIYRGHLPYREFEVDCPMDKGEKVKLWVELRDEEGQLKAFTQTFEYSFLQK